jgi:tetrapyrrole methylase family protein/MazG family protein
MKKGSLVVVGTGIKFMSQLTIEAKAYIEQSDKVLFLVNEPVMQQWIMKANPCAESLDKLYRATELRYDSYDLISNYILKVLSTGVHVCVVIYGHPTIFAKPALKAVSKAKMNGFYTKILPGVSAEDCLMADLEIDPGTSGYLSYDATDLILHQRIIDPRSHLIIWQISTIGILKHDNAPDIKIGLQLLKSYLEKFYDASTKILFYTAAQYPTFEHVVVEYSLSDLISIQPARLATLYIPPAKESISDPNVLQMLKLN